MTAMDDKAMLEPHIIKSACKCGEPVHVDVGGHSCRCDGKRPFHPGASDLTTQFRCRKCREYLAHSCEAAKFDDAAEIGKAMGEK